MIPIGGRDHRRENSIRVEESREGRKMKAWYSLSEIRSFVCCLSAYTPLPVFSIHVNYRLSLQKTREKQKQIRAPSYSVDSCLEALFSRFRSVWLKEEKKQRKGGKKKKLVAPSRALPYPILHHSFPSHRSCNILTHTNNLLATHFTQIPHSSKYLWIV